MADAGDRTVVHLLRHGEVYNPATGEVVTAVMVRSFLVVEMNAGQMTANRLTPPFASLSISTSV